MVPMLIGEWNAGFQVSFPAYCHLHFCRLVCRLVCMLNNCHIISLSTYHPQQWTFHVHSCSIPSLWGFLPISLSYYAATLLPTPGKAGLQPYSKSSRRHQIIKSCWMYFISLHIRSSLLKFPVYNLGTCYITLWCLPL